MDATEKLSSPQGMALIGLSLSIFGGKKEREAARLGTFACGLSWLTAVSLKTIFNRKRPEGEYPRWNSSFPSGHTLCSFSIATVFSYEYPSLKIPLFGLASLVGFSRVYLGKHYPSDVLAGAILGYLVGRVVWSQRSFLNKI